ncbi:hypothetical protein Pmani_032529 [Petrolisthes manimaculis]|uniref:Uncharacterized protein n=1 Tax=Petrolisthes manimaculis TaxID=1843537 RepID=A0AAE1NT68_9EUCA|nr:hypothetical protein Pmani_032529 [Petrolisthes manimaculis]
MIITLVHLPSPCLSIPTRVGVGNTGVVGVGNTEGLVHKAKLLATNVNKTPRLVRSPLLFSSNFRIKDFHENNDDFEEDFLGDTFNQENEIPTQTRSQFTPPNPPTKEGRRRKYFSFGVIGIPPPPHAHALVHEEPFFDTFDHGKAVLKLQERRKKMRLNTHLLKSLRPYFPFFSPH